MCSTSSIFPSLIMKHEINDSLLKSQICEALEQFDEEDFSQLNIEVKDQDVFVSGSFRTPDAKGRGEELIRKIRGVKSLRDSAKILK